jgi:hypothetical protein
MVKPKKSVAVEEPERPKCVEDKDVLKEVTNVITTKSNDYNCNICQGPGTVQFDPVNYFMECDMRYFDEGQRFYDFKCGNCCKTFSKTKEGENFITLKKGHHPLQVRVCCNQRFGCTGAICDLCMTSNMVVNKRKRVEKKYS